ncbi:hypothetical protein DFJ74DRAFT_532152 [Hyaloraphidium curvatum]|nr:hypothetical protein DFJ74DRAFT_532152 [Hyaloraphidium curvatum]
MWTDAVQTKHARGDVPHPDPGSMARNDAARGKPLPNASITCLRIRALCSLQSFCGLPSELRTRILEEIFNRNFMLPHLLAQHPFYLCGAGARAEMLRRSNRTVLISLDLEGAACNVLARRSPEELQSVLNHLSTAFQPPLHYRALAHWIVSTAARRLQPQDLRFAFHVSMEYGFVDMIASMQKLGVPFDPEHALERAVRADSFCCDQVVSTLLSWGCRINDRCLYLAANTGNVAVFRLLLEHLRCSAVLAPAGWRHIVVAAAVRGHETFMRFLFEKQSELPMDLIEVSARAAMDAPQPVFSYAMDLAVQEGQMRIVALLKGYGVHCSVAGLLGAAEKGNLAAMMEALDSVDAIPTGSAGLIAKVARKYNHLHVVKWATEEVERGRLE